MTFLLKRNSIKMFWFEQWWLPDRWQDGDRWRLYWILSRFGLLVLAVGGFHIIVLIGIIHLEQLQPTSPEARYLATSIWASMMLTFALIAVYRDVGETQEKQKEILDEQRRLSEFAQSALPRIIEHNIVSSEDSRSYQDSKENKNYTFYHMEPIEFTISNSGKAPATDLTCELYIGADEETHQLAIPMVEGSWKEAIDFLYSNSMDAAFTYTKGNAIESEESKKKYTAPLFDSPDWIPENWKGDIVYQFPPPSSVLHYAKRNVESDFILGFLVWYTDGSGPSGPCISRFVRVSQNDVIDLQDLRNQEDLEAEDMLDLSELFEIGKLVSVEQIPELEHPDLR